MCCDLGRWLRTAGYDTAFAEPSESDRNIYEKALKEGRILLTRDRHFKEIDTEGKTVFFLNGETLDEWVEQLRGAGIDWLYRPFSRCLKCNSILEKTTAKPDEAPQDVDECWLCPSCHQLFWRGSHTERMLGQLRQWAGKR